MFTEDDIEERVALEQAVSRVNAFNASRILKNIEIQPIIKTIQHTDILDIKEKGESFDGDLDFFSSKIE